MGQYQYPKRKQVRISKLDGIGQRPPILSNLRVKIIERALLNALEPIYEGSWRWKKISKSSYELAKQDPKTKGNSLKQSKANYFIKD